MLLCRMNPKNQYADDLVQAMDELAKMVAHREELEVQIARTKRKVALLSQLCDETDQLAPIPDLDLGGLTDACRTVLRGSRKEWMTATEIQGGLKGLGFPLEKYKAPYASITTTVSRMAEGENAEVVVSRSNNPGATEYKWVGPTFRPMSDQDWLRPVTISPPAKDSLAAMDAKGELIQGPKTKDLKALRDNFIAATEKRRRRL